MKPNSLFATCAVAFGAVLFLSTLATAGSVSPGPVAPAGANSGLVHKVSGCHRHPEYHFVYLWGYNAWHRHGRNCAPRPASPPVYSPPPPPAYNPYPVYPYPQPGYPVAPAYCHRDWQNHFHQGFGGGWHRHAGPNCRPVRGRRWRGGSKSGCVNIAGVWICG